MINKTKLHNELTDAFINYQYAQENPMPMVKDTPEHKRAIYHTDHIFKRKVDSLAGGVMEIVCRNIDDA